METVEELIPSYYHVPLQQMPDLGDGTRQLAPLADGWLTKEDFEYLYDRCGDALHPRNPFSQKDGTIQLKYKVTDWVLRIQRLLAFHVVSLAGADTKWVVEVPSQGNVRVLAAVPTVIPPPESTGREGDNSLVPEPILGIQAEPDRSLQLLLPSPDPRSIVFLRDRQRRVA